MKITLKLNKTVEQNAAEYFEKSKKAKKKLEGAVIAIEKSKKKLEKLMKNKVEKKDIIQEKKVKKEWYEKFRWFISSEGFLVLGGRDATTNEIVVKKFTDKEDLVFHTDMAGSPFFVIKAKENLNKDEKGKSNAEKGNEDKNKTKTPTEITISETANATAAFSRAWKLGLSTLDVFYVKPDQISKTAQSGEYIAKGAFMVRGKTTYVKLEKMEIAIGVKDGKVISGPLSAIEKQTKDYMIIIQGKEKSSDVAKLFRKKFGGELDDIIRMLPSGGLKINK